MLRWVLLAVSVGAFAAATQISSPGLLGAALLIGLACFVAAALIVIAERVGTVQQGQGHREVGLLMTAQQLARQGSPSAPSEAGPAPRPAPPPAPVPATPSAPHAPDAVPPTRAEPGVVPRFGPRPAGGAAASPATPARPGGAEPGVVPRFGPRTPTPAAAAPPAHAHRAAPVAAPSRPAPPRVTAPRDPKPGS